jgi:hypothetical protein
MGVMPASYMTPYMRHRRAVARGLEPPPPPRPRRLREVKQSHHRRGIFKPLAEIDNDDAGVHASREDTCVFCGLLSDETVCGCCRREIEG